MAERESTYDYGVLGSGITPRNLDRWAYTPFYKRNVYTGPSQYDQAANLMTSDSFRSYWSQGMTNQSRVPFEGLISKISGTEPLPDTTTGVRLDNKLRDVTFINRNHGRLDTTTPTTGFVKGSDNIRVYFGDELQSNHKVPSRTYWDLRNQRGALPEPERQVLSVLKYHNTDPKTGLTRYVSNNTSDDLFGLSAELEASGKGPYGVRANFPVSIMTRDAWAARSLEKSDELMSLNAQMEMERDAIIMGEARQHFLLKGTSAGPADLDTPDYSARPRPFVMPTAPQEERRVGRMTRDVVRGVDKNGKPWVDPLPSTTTTVYGPPEKYAGLRTLATNATNVARTGFSYGMSGLGLYGAIDAGMSVPTRHEAYQSAGNNWLLSQAGAQSDAMLNFMTMGAWDNRLHTGGTRGDYRGAMSARQTPAMFRGEQSVHLDPRRYVPVGMSLDDTLSRFPR